MSTDVVGPAVDPDAGAVSRLAAYVVDLAAVAVLFAGGSAVAAFLVAVVTGYDLDLQSDRDIAAVASAVWWFVYFAGSWALTGQTLGMALLGLKVVRPDRTPASGAAAVIRALTFPLSFAVFGIGFLGILFHSQRRALHDLIAGTAVVYSPAAAARASSRIVEATATSEPGP